MTTAERSITFREREFKGSRLRCLLLTSDSPSKVAAFLNSLAAPHAQVTAEDRWAPRGFLDPAEAGLGDSAGFLSEADRTTLTSWWLAQSGAANTPNWDLVSKCRINNSEGLILVEAKAHEGELADDRCGAVNLDNLNQIKKALAEASIGWNALASGAGLSANSHYQLSNRFAFSWKLATMGIPVVLVYLAFLDAHEMDSGGRILFKGHAQWRRCVLAQSKGIVSENVWDKTFDVGGTPLTIAIKSAVVGVHANSVNDGVDN
jgi:hypothetical protein